MSLKTAPRHRMVAKDRNGGAAGNERLTAMTGLVLLMLLAGEGVTILARRQLLTLHFFLGMLLIGPVLLKLATTCYRFARYYAGSPGYVRKGPPALLLRLLGPVVIVASIGVIGSGVVLAFLGPRPSQWLSLAMIAHRGFFILWFGAMTIHVLWYAPRLPGLLTSRKTASENRGQSRAGALLAGAGQRWLALTAALALGLVLALATYHLAGPWTSFWRGG